MGSRLADSDLLSLVKLQAETQQESSGDENRYFQAISITVQYHQDSSIRSA